MHILPKFKSIPFDVEKRLFLFSIAFIIFFLSLALVMPASTQATVSAWQKAITFYPLANNDFNSSGFRQSLRNAQSLGANMATFVIPYYQTSDISSDIQPGWNTPTKNSLIGAIEFAHALGMQVSLKIHMTPYYGDAWAAYIDPTDKAAWFTNYGKILNSYATIARQQNVEEICVGNELIKLSTNTQNLSYWDNLISGVRQIYSGKLTYNANAGGDDFSNELNKIPFWNDLDYIGVSAYPALQGDLEKSWQSWNEKEILPIVNKYQKPVLFTEVGYRSTKNAHLAPWYFNLSGEVDLQEQAKDYQTLFSYWNKIPYMQGLNLWGWETDPSAGGKNNNQYTIQNKPAEKVVGYWFNLK
jgi:hypothetical protein